MTSYYYNINGEEVAYENTMEILDICNVQKCINMISKNEVGEGKITFVYKNSRPLGYNELRCVEYALLNDIDPFLLIDPTGNRKYQFDFYQMAEIIKGVKHHTDISVYRDSKYDSSQMEEIRLGLEKDGHVSYDHPCILTNIMEKIRDGEWDISRKEAIRMSYEWYPAFVVETVRENNIHGRDLREVREVVKGIVK